MAEKKPTPKPPQNTKRQSLFLRAVFLFLVSAWMFFLGVLVGRGTAPVRFDIDKLQKELAALKKTSLDREIKRYKINSPNTDEKPDLGFHKALKLPEEDVRLSEKKPAEPGPRAPLPDKTRQAPVPKEAEDLYIKAMIESGRVYTIQVAASQDKKISDRMVSRLKDKNYPAYLETAVIPGKGTWYRVRIGGFRGREEAERFLDTLRENNLKGMVIKR